MIKELLVGNYTCFLICLYLIAFFVSDRSFERQVRHLFLWAVIALLTLSIADSVDYAISQQSTPYFIRNISTSVGYILRPVTIYCIALIIRRNVKKKNIWISLPLFINIALTLISIPTGIMFSFDAVNEFHRGPLGFLPHVVAGFYMIVMIVWTVQVFRRNGTGEMLTVIIIVVMSIAATIIESILSVKFVLTDTIGISLAVYYLYLHIQIYKRDALTGLLNRRVFYLDGEDSEKETMAVISLDLNNLKKINDKYGHDAGDTAIITIVEATRQALKPGCQFYRTGGDEFMILGHKLDKEAAEEMIRNIQGKIMTTKYSAAIGLAMYEPGKDFQGVCSQADAYMYEDKRKSKEGRP